MCFFWLKKALAKEKGSMQKINETTIHEIVKDRDHIKNLREKDSVEQKNDVIKRHTASEKKIEIEAPNKRLTVKLLTPYTVSGLIASDDTKVAELQLLEWENVNLFEGARFFDVKNSYKEVQRTFRFKYGIEKTYKDERGTHNWTEWIPFDSLSELPHQNIKIGIFTATTAKETIEWIPTIEGFEILEWAAYDISTATYVDSLDVSGQDANPTGMAFNGDGSKLYMTGYSSDSIHEYDLSTNYDISTGTYVDTLDVSGQDSSLRGMAFNGDGSKVYIVGNETDSIYEYDLSPNYDVSTGSYVDSLDVSGQDSGPNGIAFNGDGSKLYMVGYNSESIHEYDLSTNYDISTGTYVDSLDVSGQEGSPRGMAFNGDGSKLYMVGYSGDNIYEYDLSPNYDVSTGSYVDNLDVSGQDGSSEGMAFNGDGSKLYIVGRNNVSIYEYDIPTNTAPSAPTNPSPADTATGVATDTTLSVDVSDPDGDAMDVSFYWSDTTLIETVTGVASGGTATTGALSLNNDTTYNWYAIADDGTDTTQSSTWSFTTEAEKKKRHEVVRGTWW